MKTSLSEHWSKPTGNSQDLLSYLTVRLIDVMSSCWKWLGLWSSHHDYDYRLMTMIVTPWSWLSHHEYDYIYTVSWHRLTTRQRTQRHHRCHQSPLKLLIGIDENVFQKTCSPWISARASYQLWHFWLELLNWWKWISKEKCSPWNSALTLLIGIGWIYENEFQKKNVAKEKSCSCKLSALIFLMKMNCSPWKAVHASWF